MDLNLKNQVKGVSAKQAKWAKVDRRNTITKLLDIHHQSLILGIKCRSSVFNFRHQVPIACLAQEVFFRRDRHISGSKLRMYYDYIKPFGPCINHHSIAFNPLMSSRTIIL